VGITNAFITEVIVINTAITRIIVMLGRKQSQVMVCRCVVFGFG
jgi:hypothetical protein